MGQLGDEALRLGESDQAEAVGADRDRQLVEGGVIGLAQGGDRRRRAVDVRAVGDLERLDAGAAHGNQAEAVGADRDRCVVATARGAALERARRRRRACDVRAMRDLQVVQRIGSDGPGGGYWPTTAETMVGDAQLDNIQSCVTAAVEDDIPGVIIGQGICILHRHQRICFERIAEKFRTDSAAGKEDRAKKNASHERHKGDNCWHHI